MYVLLNFIMNLKNSINIFLFQNIRSLVKEIDQSAKRATIALQIIHSSIVNGNFFLIINKIWHILISFYFPVSAACLEARGHFEECKIGYGKLSQLIPPGQYYRYCDHWHYLTQRVVFLIALTIYLEKGILVSKETVSEILQCKFVCFSNGFFFKYIFC